MNTIILYVSQTGFTEQYARWLAEDLSCDCLPYARQKEVNFDRYEAVIYGSWRHAGQIQKIHWFNRLLPEWKTKKIALFAVGAMPADSPEAKAVLTQNLTSEACCPVAAFYLPGGLRYDRMPMASRWMMKAFSSMIAKKKDKTDQEEEMAKWIGRSYDLSDRAYINPIVEAIRD